MIQSFWDAISKEDGLGEGRLVGNGTDSGNVIGFTVSSSTLKCYEHCNAMLIVGIIPDELSRKEPLSWEQGNCFGVLILFRCYCCILSSHLPQPLPRITVVIAVYLRHVLTSFNKLVVLTPGHATYFSRSHHHHQPWSQKGAGGSWRSKWALKHSLRKGESTSGSGFYLVMAFPPCVESSWRCQKRRTGKRIAGSPSWTGISETVYLLVYC